MRKISYLSILIVVFAFIFIILAYKNPFSAQSTLANLEPYPDTLYYGYPAWSFVHGDGFAMRYGSIATKIIVPPVYSIYLVPFFLIVNDIRVFYLANMLLALASLILLMKVLQTIFGESRGAKFTLFISGLLYVTSFYIFTLPSLLMAENITLFLVTVGLYLFVSPVRRYTYVLMGCVMALLVLVKFSNFPITLAFSTLFLIKAFHKDKRDGIKLLAWLTAGAMVVFFYVVVSKILVGHKNLQGTETIALHNLLPNLSNYFALLMGTQTSFLWYTEKLISPLMAVLAMGGIIVGLCLSKWRDLTLAMLGLLVSTLVAMSFFTKVDGRYFIALFPAVIILVSIFLHSLITLIARKREVISVIVVFLIALVYFIYPGFGYVQGEPVAISLKKQIGLNFKHKSDPWNYHAVQNLNSYFDKKADKKPYVGTVLPPFYVAFYANGNYQYLPLTLSQEFISMDDVYRKNVMKTRTMVEYYSNLLDAGHEVYVTNSYLGNVKGWGDEFSNLSKYFTLKLVKEGCVGSCNIYKVVKR
jgi:hypothetical protein